MKGNQPAAGNRPGPACQGWGPGHSCVHWPDLPGRAALRAARPAEATGAQTTGRSPQSARKARGRADQPPAFCRERNRAWPPTARWWFPAGQTRSSGVGTEHPSSSALPAGGVPGPGGPTAAPGNSHQWVSCREHAADQREPPARTATDTDGPVGLPSGLAGLGCCPEPGRSRSDGSLTRG